MNTSTTRKRTIGQRLRQERECLNYSQEELAEKIGTTALSINRWEHDKTLPRPFYRAALCQIFNKSAPALFGLPEGEEEGEASALPPIWNVPHLRNLYFTGREQVLTYLRNTLASRKTVVLTQPRAISGLGGIGKTQTAVEYAYRYGADYKAVLWARADFYKSLISDFLALAALLDLPERTTADQGHAVEAVKRWLQGHSHWLLILDNADDLEMISDFLPTRGAGHVLLTSRSQATGPHIKGIELEKMGQEEGALLLLHRAKLLAEDAPLESASAQDRCKAEAICELLDGLPLALDQAAAYIEENRCTFADYLSLYKTRQGDLLKRRGTFSKRGYPQSVATTWSLSFEQVEQADPLAADLLGHCAFLHPDTIAETMFLEGATELGPVLQPLATDSIRLDAALGELRKYSLVRRNPETKTITIHRLVQTVLKDRMDRETQQAWAERTVRMLNKVFPNPNQIETWSVCQQYLPHAQICADLIEQWEMRFPAAAQLLNQAGTYLYKRGRYTEAERLLQQALAIREQILTEDHPDRANSLYNLANLYRSQDKHEQAEPLYQRALAMCEATLGYSHPSTAECCNDLAWLYYERGKYDYAEPLYQRAISIREQVFGENHSCVALSLDNLGLVYAAQSRFEQAEPLMCRALTIREQVLGPDHPDVAESLNNLAKVYHNMGRYEQAEVLMERALATYEQILGPNHPDVSASLNGLGIIYTSQGQYEQAEPLFQRAIAIREQVLGLTHHYVAISLNSLASLYYRQGKYEQAEALIRRALAIYKPTVGPNHHLIAACLTNLGKLYQAQGKYEQAEPLYQRVLTMDEQLVGPDNPEVANALSDLALFYVSQHKYEQAEPLFRRALLIREHCPWLKPAVLTSTLKNYADLLRRMGRAEEAVLLEERARGIEGTDRLHKT